MQKRHQHVTQVKEIRFHPNTDTHDFEFKVRHARAFLEEGDKVKATVVFKGREITYKEQGKEMLEKFTERISDIAKVEQFPKMEGRQMIAYYVADPGAFMTEINRSLKGLPRFPIDIKFYHDEEWSDFRDLVAMFQSSEGMADA